MNNKGLSKFFLATLIAVMLTTAYPCLASDDKSAIEKQQIVLDIFRRISSVPRCSGNEDQISKWIRDFAKECGYKSETDNAGNVLIRVPPTIGLEKAPATILQCHMDMVCAKDDGSTHDFSKDPIKLLQDSEWLKANKTTLGADNGIGMAIALSLLTKNIKSHPGLELLFTVQEESSMSGATNLDARRLKGEKLISLDSENESVITIGSAGATVTFTSKKLSYKSIPNGWKFFSIRVDGLQGGHSGVDIGKKRGNAIQILAQILDMIGNSTELRLVKIHGGSKHNVIPSEAEAVVIFPSDKITNIENFLGQYINKMGTDPAIQEKELKITVKELEPKGALSKSLDSTDTDQTVALLRSIPSGILSMHPVLHETVETSNNIGFVEIKGDVLSVHCMQRGSDKAKLTELTESVKRIASASRAETKVVFHLDPWEPSLNSDLAKRSKQVYKNIFNEEPAFNIIHAGLECAIIGEKMKNVDMMAIGPTIEYAHTPKEKVYIPSIQKVVLFLEGLLASFEN